MHKIVPLKTPPKPKWLEELDRIREQYIDEHFVIPDALRGTYSREAGKVYQIQSELMRPRWLKWGKSEAYVASQMQRELQKIWKKFHTNKKKGVNMFRKWKQMKERVNIMFDALKWSGIIEWDTWNERFGINKVGAHRIGVGYSVPIPDLKARIEIADNRIEEIKGELDEFKEDLEQLQQQTKLNQDIANETIKLIEYFFVHDYFTGDGKDEAPTKERKFNGMIPRATAVSFEKLSILGGFTETKIVEVLYTTPENAQEHKATISRYKKEVANYKNNLKQEK